MDIEILKQVIYNNYGRKKIVNKFGLPEMKAREYRIIANNLDTIKKLFQTDQELVEKTVKAEKQKQKYRDVNRVERKSFREHARVENAVSVYVKELKELLDQNKIKVNYPQQRKDSNDRAAGVIQISDTHFNEIVDLTINKYDFTIASKRIRKHILQSLEYFKTKNITNVVVALTGDLLNSDRRLDELLTNATNRARATFLSVQILENAILELNKHFNVTVASVLGNESRVTQEYTWANNVVSDNYDFTIYGMLSYHLRNQEGIDFIGGDTLKKVVNIGGYNWLLIHGHQKEFKNDPLKATTKLIAQYKNRGINIRYVLFGHIHEALIADIYARSSSSVGANAYSEESLLYISRASQNSFIQYENGNIDGIKIDIQNADEIIPYPVQRELEAYNAKSSRKNKKGETIFKVTI